MKRLWAWWTLSNVTKAADLALKLAALVAVFAVLHFFQGRGDVYPLADCWAPVGPNLDQGIANEFHLTAAEAKITVAGPLGQPEIGPVPIWCPDSTKCRN